MTALSPWQRCRVFHVDTLRMNAIALIKNSIKISPKMAVTVGATDDLAKLAFLDETRLLHELRVRYSANNIYVCQPWCDLRLTTDICG